MTYQKDVFVSYSSSDVTWVETELLQRLRAAQVEYVEPRNFRLGAPRIREIERAITTSRRTLLVVTKSYLNDAFAEFENGIAFAHSLETRSWSVVPLIKEDHLDLPPSISNLVTQNLVDASEEVWRDFFNKLSSEPLSDAIEIVESDSRPTTTNLPATQPAPPDKHPARTGLNLLVELMSNSDVSGSISNFREDFQILAESMQKLKLLKELHDKFQLVESSAAIVCNYARPDAGGNVYWDAMEYPQIDLADKITDLVDVACGWKFAQLTDMWVDRLLRSKKELQDGIVYRQLDVFRGASRKLSSVLDSLPAKINIQMVTEARALRLNALVRALWVVHGLLQDLRSELATENHLTKIEESAKRISKMDLELKTVLYVHDFLQEVDSENRRIEALLDDGVTQIIEFWEEVNPRIEAICSGNADDWAIKLFAASADLKRNFPPKDIAFSTNPIEFNEVRKNFHLFRVQVTRSFNRVDQDMIRKCNELEVEIQRPLAPLLALLQPA